MSLSEDTKIYRFVSFYDAFDILINKKLRLSKLSSFEDRNEGVGAILEAQDCVRMRHEAMKANKIKDIYNFNRNNKYLSCWTEEPDMIAMWAIYSKDQSAIRLETTVGKLEKALFDAWRKICWSECGFDDEGFDKAHIAWFSEVSKVDYVNFFDIRDSIRQKHQEFYRNAELKAKNNRSYFDFEGGFIQDFLALYDSNEKRMKGLFLKDIAYKHEAEVRGVLHCGVVDKNSVKKWRSPSSRQGIIPKLDPIRAALPDESPTYIYADLPEDFIDGICFDPRMPNYQQEIYKQIFGDTVTNIATSIAFGCALEQDSFESTIEGYLEER